jgi:hypothetical protein
LLVTTSWALAAAARSSRLVAADVDPVEVINAALRQTAFGYLLVPLHSLVRHQLAPTRS